MNPSESAAQAQPWSLDDVVEDTLISDRDDDVARRVGKALAILGTAREGALEPERVMWAALRLIEQNPVGNITSSDGRYNTIVRGVDEILARSLEQGARGAAPRDAATGALLKAWPLAIVMAGRMRLPRSEAALMARAEAREALNTNHGGTTLGHVLMDSHDIDGLERAVAGGMALRMDDKASWPWEAWAGDMPVEVMQRLEALGHGAFPRDMHDYNQAMQRLRVGTGRASFAMAARTAKMGAIARRLGGGNRLPGIGALLAVQPTTYVSWTNGEAPSTTLRAEDAQALIRLPGAALVEPVKIPAGKHEETWTVAGAVVWAALVSGSALVRDESDRKLFSGVTRLSALFPGAVAALDALGDESPVLDTPIFQRSGHPATLRGLMALVRIRDAHWKDEREQSTRPAMPEGYTRLEWERRGTVSERDQRAAAETFAAAGVRFGASVRSALANDLARRVLHATPPFGGWQGGDKAHWLLEFEKASKRGNAPGGERDLLFLNIVQNLTAASAADARAFMAAIAGHDGYMAETMLGVQGHLFAGAIAAGIRAMAAHKPEVATALVQALPRMGPRLLEGLDGEEGWAHPPSVLSGIGTGRTRAQASCVAAELLVGCACALFPRAVLASLDEKTAVTAQGESVLGRERTFISSGKRGRTASETCAANWIAMAVSVAATGEGGIVGAQWNLDEARLLARLLFLARRQCGTFAFSDLSSNKNPRALFGARLLRNLQYAVQGQHPGADTLGAGATDLLDESGDARVSREVRDLLCCGWHRLEASRVSIASPLALLQDTGFPMAKPREAALALHSMLGGRGVTAESEARMKSVSQAFVLERCTQAAARPRKRG